MARIVGSFGVPHNPHFYGLVQGDDPQGREVRRLYAEVTSRLDAVRPDAVVFVTSDHYNIFFEECIPIFSIGVAESAWGPSDYPSLPYLRVPLQPELARRVRTDLVDSGFDVGLSQEFRFDHTVISPLLFLDPGLRIPLVPVFVNGLVRPLPSSRRCLALGRAIRAAVERYPEPLRVAVVASGSFSLEIGGPRISDRAHFGIPDPAWMERVLGLLGRGAFEELVGQADDAQLQRAGNAGGELLDWIVMLGMTDPCPPDFLAAQPEYGHAFGAWPATPAGPGEPGGPA